MEEKISQSQLFMMYVLMIYGSDVGFVLAVFTQNTEYVGWLCLLLGWAGGLVFVYLALRLARTHPEESIVRFGSKLIGRPLHVLFMGSYIFYTMHIAATILRELCDFMLLTYLEVTPIGAVATLFGLCIILAVRSGLETIFRCAQGFFFIVITVVLLTPLLLTKSYDWGIAGAFLHHWELSKIRPGSIVGVTLFNDMTLAIFLYPHLRDKKHTFRSVAAGSAGALILTVMTYFICLLLFGVHYTGHASYPTLEMMRMIRVGDFLDNLDPFLIAIWMTTLFLKISLYLYIVTVSAGQCLGLKNCKPLAFSVGALMIGYSIQIADSIMELQEFLRKAYPIFTYLFAQLPLLLYWPGYWLWKRRLKNQQPQAAEKG